MKIISGFVAQFNASIALDESLIANKNNRYFLLNQNLKRLLRKELYYAGTYLGKTKDGKFFPSFSLLAMISRGNANKVIVDRKTAWLFICGRDVFQQGMTKVLGSRKKSSYTLVLNEYDECLGFGKITRNLDEKRTGLAIKNISDIGDFLRREQ